MKQIVDTIQNLGAHEQRNVVAALQDLLEVNLDAETGYAHAADDVKDPGLKSLFASWSVQRREFAEALTGLLRDLGIEPNPPHSLRAKLHIKWLDLRAAIDHGAPSSVLAECERGEHTALSHYEHALKLSMPANVESVLLDQVSEVRRTREALDNMRRPW